jgi:dihydroorotate dehydrogenase electron transfer subunit
MNYIDAKVKEVEYPSVGYALIRFGGDVPIKGMPGQFVMVRGDWDTDPILPRAFSVVEVGMDAAILVRDVGKGTKKLARIRRGDPLAVLGPLGQGFSHLNAASRPILVAGGVGVAPLIFLAEYFHSRSIEVTFLYGAKTGEDLLFVDRIKKAANLIITTEDGSFGETGMITEPLEHIFCAEGNFQVFSCGPDPMLRQVYKSSSRRGISCQVALESPMACGMGTCKGCAVEASDGNYVYVCCDGPVFDSNRIYGGAS